MSGHTTHVHLYLYHLDLYLSRSIMSNACLSTNTVRTGIGNITNCEGTRVTTDDAVWDVCHLVV